MLRPLREGDADAVAALFRRAFGDGRPMDAEEILGWLRNPELRREWLQVLERDGEVVGYGDISTEGGEVALDVAAPGHWERFLDWAEERARAASAAKVRTYFPAGHELAEVVAARGYRYWRSSYTMRIELGDAPPQPGALPAGLEIRAYEAEDVEPLRAALNEAFACDPFFHEATRANFEAFYLGRHDFEAPLWRLAWDGVDLAGFALAWRGAIGEPELGWVGSLGVRPPWRRRGLGEALLRSAFRELHARGRRRVGLGVDASNETGAVRLYERVGMRQARRWDNWALELGTSGGPQGSPSQ